MDTCGVCGTTLGTVNQDNDDNTVLPDFGRVCGECAQMWADYNN